MARINNSTSSVVGLVLAVISCAMVGVNSECCPKTTVFWTADNCYAPNTLVTQVPQNFTIQLDDAGASTHHVCSLAICGDGKAIEGFYCGVGPCNVFGCNCDGGCVRGNPLENFKKLTGIGNAVTGFRVADLPAWFENKHTAPAH